MAITYTIDAPTPVLAYSERESRDPDTGVAGILRQEWRAVSFDSAIPSHEILRQACAHISFFPTMVLECRYIRRGSIEPWTADDVYEHLDGRFRQVTGSYVDGQYVETRGPGESSYGLLESLLSGHSLRGPIVALDPRLKLMQEQEAEETRVVEERRVEQASKRAELEEKARQRRRGDNTFRKMRLTGNEKDKALCIRWIDLVTHPQAAGMKDTFLADPRFMELYNAALYSNKIPSKRKTLREFLNYAEKTYASALGSNTSA